MSTAGNRMTEMKIAEGYEMVLEEAPFGGIHTSFETFFFNRPEFRQEDGPGKTLLFSLRRSAFSSVEAFIRFTILDGTAFSPLRAPLGAFEFRSELPSEVLRTFVKYSTDVLRNREKVTRIFIKSYPVCYRETEAMVMHDLLLEEGFRVVAEEVNQHIIVSDQPLAERFHPSERRKLKKCIDAGLVFAEEHEPDIGELYELLQLSRKRKNFPVSVTERDLQAMLYEMPDRYRTFTVRDKNRLAAFAVGVAVNRDILYHFIPAHHYDYDGFSPACMLTEGIYRRCQGNRKKILDLGISSVDSRLNEGLYRFKKHLGAKDSRKFSFEKVWQE